VTLTNVCNSTAGALFAMKLTGDICHETYRRHRLVPWKDCGWHCLGIRLVLLGYGGEMAVFDPT